MSTTIDAAGRLVIPKELRERAGLLAGTRVDFRFHDGVIEIAPTTIDVESQSVGRVDYPVFEDRGLTTDAIARLIEVGRDERA